MRKALLITGLIAAAAVAFPVAAQTGTAMVAKGPGVVGGARTIKVTGTITAIDAATRAVTVKGPQGKEVVFDAGPEVKNFAQMKVGDQVNVEFIEALTLELKKGGGLVVSATEKAGAVAAKPGERPAGAVGRQVTVVADVIAVDAKTQVITLKGPQRTVDLKVADPEQFKRIAKGDQVEATYSEALANKVEPAKAAPKK